MLNGCTDTLRRCLGLAVTNMGITQCHARPLVAKQARDDGERDTLQNGVAREGMTKVMQTHIFDSGLHAHRTPERQVMRKRTTWVRGRREDVGARRARLSLQNGAGRLTEEDPSRSGLGAGKNERIPVNVLSAQSLGFAVPAKERSAGGHRLPRAAPLRAWTVA